MLKGIRPEATADDIRTLTPKDAKAIYRKECRDQPRAGRFPPLVGVVFYDLAVNAGPQRPTLHMKQAPGVDVDGVVGEETLTALDG